MSRHHCLLTFRSKLTICRSAHVGVHAVIKQCTNDYIRRRDRGKNRSAYGKMDLENYSHITSMDDAGFVQYLQDHGLLRWWLHCNACNRLHSQVRKKGVLVCGYILWCPDCKTKKKLTTDTILEAARLPMQKFFGILYMWSHAVSITTATSLLGVSSQTLVQRYHYFQ